MRVYMKRKLEGGRGVKIILRDITYVLFNFIFLPQIIKWIFPFESPLFQLFIFVPSFLFFGFFFVIYIDGDGWTEFWE